MADTLGPVEVEFTIPDDFGKQADAAIKKMAGLTDTSTSAVKQVKEAYEEQKAVIKQIESDIKDLERQLKNVAPGKGKMEITQELQAAKQALTEETAILGQRKAELDQSAVKQDRVTTSIRATRNEMAQMILAGKEQSQEFKDLEAKAAGYVEALNQANQVTKNLGDDQRRTKGLMEGATGLSGAFSAGAGAVALFAGENENLVKIQTKVQGLMAITIGLQEVSQALDKESAFMSVTVAKAKQMWATAEKALTAALWGSNVAAKALMGTLTLGLAVAIPALISLYDRFTTKQAELKKVQMEAAKVQADASVSAGKAGIELELTIKKIERFNGSKQSEARMIKEVNSKYGEAFGTYKTLAQWLDVLKSKAADYVQVMFLQARANQSIANMLKFDEQKRRAQTAPLSQFIGSDYGYQTVLTPGGPSRMYNAELARQQGEEGRRLAIENAQAWYDVEKRNAEQFQKELEALQNKSGINTYIDTPTPSNTANPVAQTFEQQIQLVKQGLELYKMAVDQGLTETANVFKAEFKIPEGITSFSDYIKEELQKAIEAKDHAKIKALLPEKAALNAGIKDAASGLDYAPLLEKYATYEDKVADLTAQSNREIKALKDKGYDEEADIARKAFQDQYNQLAEHELKSTDQWEFLFDNLSGISKDALKLMIDKAQQMLSTLTDPEMIRIVTDQINKLKGAYDGVSESQNKLVEANSWAKLYNDIQDFKSAEQGTIEQGNALVQVLKQAVNVINDAVAGLGDMVNLMQTLGVISQEDADSMKETNQQLQGVVDGLSAVLTGNPADAVNGLIRALDNLIKLHDVKGKKIAKYQDEELSKLAEIERAYNRLQTAVNNALGTDKYKLQEEQIDLNKKKIEELQKLVDSEMSKKAKKRDNSAIADWQDQIDELNVSIDETLQSINDDLTQISVNEFANDLADAFVGAFDAGTDAAEAFGDVIDNVIKNAVKHAIILKYISEPLKLALDQFAEDMKDDNGVLTPEELKFFKDSVYGIFSTGNDMYTATMNALGIEPGTADATNSTNGKANFSYMKQETGDALLGQFTSLRMSAAITAEIAQDEMMSRRAMFQDLKQIAANTFQSAQSLKSIDSRIQTIENEGIKIK